MTIRSSLKTGLLSAAALFLLFSAADAAQFEVNRPGKLSIPRDIKKVFIDPQNINDSADRLKLKSVMLKALQTRLDSLGRFEVTVGPPGGFDPNRETVAVIQGDIISGGEVDQGQFTEKAECKGGLAGLAGAGSARSSSEQGITFSRRGMLCKVHTLQSHLVEQGLSAGLSLLGVQEFPPYDEVVRIYRYKNLSLFAQANLSFTQIGSRRETLSIRSDAASFSRHKVARGSFRNVRESGDNAPLIWLWFRFAPIAPVVIREIGVIQATNPDSYRARWYERTSPKIEDIDPAEKKEVLNRLVNKTLNQFIQSISPYKAVIQADVATGGNSAAAGKIESGQYLTARKMLTNATTPDDLYNLGLTFEAAATTIEDYEDAKRYYSEAFSKEPSSRLFAQGIGRMEFQLRIYKNARRQAVN